jgi:hypothetical protein
MDIDEDFEIETCTAPMHGAAGGNCGPAGAAAPALLSAGQLRRIGGAHGCAGLGSRGASAQADTELFLAQDDGFFMDAGADDDIFGGAADGLELELML